MVSKELREPGVLEEGFYSLFSANFGSRFTQRICYGPHGRFVDKLLQLGFGLCMDQKHLHFVNGSGIHVVDTTQYKKRKTGFQGLCEDYLGLIHSSNALRR